MKANHDTLTLTDFPQPPKGKTGWPWTKGSKPFSKYMPDGSDWPRVSVITPSYNQGQFLEETIRSVLLQGYPNLEYIIIDGGSTDNSIEIIKKYQSRITYWLSEKDKGQAHAINKGLKISTGSILGWINSDDLYTKDALKKVIQAFYQNQLYTLVHGNRILINENSEVTGCSPLSPFIPETTSYNISSETVFWKRSIMEKAGLLKESLQFAMDLEFFCRLYLCGKFLKLDEYLGYFRCYSFNKSSTIPHIGIEEASREWESIFGSKFTVKRNKVGKITLLRSFITNPQLIGLPYAKYKISKYLGN
ncbi:glycosyltransferase family 2 protein [Nodosilinea sp. FACHB-13]|uniref:glycosyltransferase family 2 protein n=1 Tax=Cyanophyceae TaxID=3028117 RepID=UPI0016887922|nr:glycosyltransferase family 2 protein [Nodosilinea sp. FACHB-13]MBD2107743.1 glycosyltransferase [Nodosilinea sp. FACHB-13]